MDQRLFLLINHEWIHPLLDKPMAALSSWDFWWPFLVAAAAIVLVFGNFHARAFVICAGLCIGVTDGLVVASIKKAVGRPRPGQVLEGVRMIDLARAKPRFLALSKPLRVEYSQPSIGPVRGRSFPSSHASNNFALATALIVFYRKWGWLYLIPAFLVAYSRMYVGSHYPLDTAIAMILGAGISLLVLALCEWAWRRCAGWIFPRLHGRHGSLIQE